MSFIPDENMFGLLGLKENPENYTAVVGLYDYFWALKPETREKMIEGWIEALQAYLEEDYEDNLPDYTEGVILVSESFPVEDKQIDFSTNVVPFRRKE